MVAAVAVVNCWGDVLSEDGRPLFGGDIPAEPAISVLLQNTTVAVVLTNAKLSKTDCFLLAQSGHTGLARSIHPAHSRFDGDAVVALATGEVVEGVSVDWLRAVAVDVVATAVRTAVS
jgi:L-aminopeptidase/D-esterase-like protein